MRYIRVFIFINILLFCLPALAAPDDTRTQLEDLAKSIRIAEKQDEAIEAKLNEAIAEKKDLENRLFKTRLNIAHGLYELQRLEQSSAQWSFLLPDTTFSDYRKSVHHEQNVKNILTRTLSSQAQSFIELEQRQIAIENYRRKREDIAMSVNHYLRMIQDHNDARPLSESIRTAVQELANDYKSLDSFLNELIIIPVTDLNETRELKFALPVSGVIGNDGNFMTIRSAQGALATAPESGMVMYADTYGALGDIVIINHGQNYMSVMRGLSSLLVKSGTEIDKGQPIGIIGSKWENIGNTSMLYFGLRYNKQSINPLTRISGF